MKCDFCCRDLEEIKKDGGVIVEGRAARICSDCVKLAKKGLGDVGTVIKIGGDDDSGPGRAA